MRNRAKCRLCQTVIESTLENESVICFCGEIEIYGGSNKFGVYARDYANFIRIDDNDKEVEVKVIEKKKNESRALKPSRSEMILSLSEMIKSIERLPKQAMLTAINHYDYCSLLILLESIFAIDKEDRDQS